MEGFLEDFLTFKTNSSRKLLNASFCFFSAAICLRSDAARYTRRPTTESRWVTGFTTHCRVNIHSMCRILMSLIITHCTHRSNATLRRQLLILWARAEAATGRLAKAITGRWKINLVSAINWTLTIFAGWWDHQRLASQRRRTSTRISVGWSPRKTFTTSRSGGMKSRISSSLIQRQSTNIKSFINFRSHWRMFDYTRWTTGRRQLDNRTITIAMRR